MVPDTIFLMLFHFWTNTLKEIEFVVHSEPSLAISELAIERKPREWRMEDRMTNYVIRESWLSVREFRRSWSLVSVTRGQWVDHFCYVNLYKTLCDECWWVSSGAVWVSGASLRRPITPHCPWSSPYPALCSLPVHWCPIVQGELTIYGKELPRVCEPL